MTGCLVVAEIAGGQLRKSTLSAIAFAKRAGGPFAVLAMGRGIGAAVEELRAYGAEKVIAVDGPSLAEYVCERFAPTVVDVARREGRDTIAFAATTFGKDLAPHVAALLGAGYAPDITRVNLEGAHRTYGRPMYAGNAIGWLEVKTPLHVVSVRPTEFAAAERGGETSPVETAAQAPDGPGARVEVLSVEAVQSARPDLAEARVVVAGGRALKEQFTQLLEPLADYFHAAIGASRAACDAGYAAPELQVGQTGRTVAPQLYFAVGISGAIQHVAGMKGSKVIVAINKDPDAPIFQIADYGLVQDLFVAIPELVKELEAAR